MVMAVASSLCDDLEVWGAGQKQSEQRENKSFNTAARNFVVRPILIILYKLDILKTFALVII